MDIACKKPVVKVCGLTRAANIEAIVDAGADLIGFIFVPESPRYVGNTLSPVQLKHLPESVIKVGVFRDASVVYILEMVRRYHLDAVQLHGGETVEDCKNLKEYSPELKVARAFQIYPTFDWPQLDDFGKSVDWFVFDTPSALGGGSGEQFNWDSLTEYGASTPFLLAGGIGADNCKAALDAVVGHPQGWGIDINSRVETEAGVKSLTLTAKVIEEVRRYGLGK
jgi:phosphoribosylanthranilate isomerase